jgi:hypothetical protein
MKLKIFTEISLKHHQIIFKQVQDDDHTAESLSKLWTAKQLLR